MGKETIINPRNEGIPYRINPKRDVQRHLIYKMTKVKERLLNATREKWQITYKGTTIRLSADFSAGNPQARTEWHDIFKVMKGENLQPRILHPARLSFRFDGEIKDCGEKQKLKDCSTTTPALQKI